VLAETAYRFLEHVPVKGIGPRRNRIYKKLRISYFIEGLAFARLEFLQ
jgi:hypothetical protein